MCEALLGLGSNLGDRAANLGEALRRLAAAGRVVAVSPVYETAPVGYAAQGDFLNACCVLETALDPEALLAVCLEIDRAMGRERTIPNGPRPIDVDILLWRDDSGADLERAEQLARAEQPGIPHPRMHLRRFVLAPAADIAAEWRHPALGRTVAELLAELPPEAERVRRLRTKLAPPTP